MKNILLLIVIGIFIFFIIRNKKETYSQAAITQLIAKGPQDAYLSADAIKYIPPIYYTGYGHYGGSMYYPWNISTRLGKYMPLYYPRYHYGLGYYPGYY